MNSNTTLQHKEVIARCKILFEKKNQDYGTAWRILRLPSITDQMMIKAKRIRTLQEKSTQRVPEGMDEEFVGLVNYGIMALMQMQFQEQGAGLSPHVELSKCYDQSVQEITALLENKNHDYEEAWRQMRVSSITDIILMKLLRLKNIEDNEGKTLLSEGPKANYMDIVNYAVFALINLGYAV